MKILRSGLNRYKLFRNILNNYIKAILIKCRNKHWANKLKILDIKDRSLWKTLKFLQRKRVPSPPFVLSDQTIIYNLIEKAEALAKNFHSVYNHAANLTSPHNPVVDDYIARLDKMIPPSNINFLTPYLVLNTVKQMPNDKAFG